VNDPPSATRAPERLSPGVFYAEPGAESSGPRRRRPTVRSPIGLHSSSGSNRLMANHRLVYSTQAGRTSIEPSTPRARRDEPARGTPGAPGAGVVRIFRERGGRGGKVVTVIRGLRLAARRPDGGAQAAVRRRRHRQGRRRRDPGGSARACRRTAPRAGILREARRRMSVPGRYPSPRVVLGPRRSSQKGATSRGPQARGVATRWTYAAYACGRLGPASYRGSGLGPVPCEDTRPCLTAG
jgi:hypothetical protein